MHGSEELRVTATRALFSLSEGKKISKEPHIYNLLYRVYYLGKQKAVGSTEANVFVFLIIAILTRVK